MQCPYLLPYKAKMRAATQDATLVLQARPLALTRRLPQAGLLHHSDRVSTYTSEAIKRSYSKKACEPYG